MNVTLRAISAYGKNNTPLRTNRGIEYEVFARVTRSLTEALNADVTEFPKLVEALHANRQLWNTLAADVADVDNALPEMLRAQIFYLAEFVNFHTSKALAGNATVSALLDVNLSVMRGLSLKG
ncbi:flagellar protein FlaF [Litoreibacter ascidiaceicola]|uniref:Flagellar protein FlaF n=1 Tax=Litoreibacter ascidiaceicola TaxID=1486859 RepID=A0A1M5AT61_9RHOB|nr:flagellar biosynthesis regulator FlaF [Litoreibacter ascidiaceicola]SHF33132.1 flagellar protein FlaF [Litoreibacter ascidiaceicola]